MSFGSDSTLLTLKDFLDAEAYGYMLHYSAPNCGYAWSESVPDTLPFAKWFGRPWDRTCFFLAKSYAVSELHQDSYLNVFANVVGCRRWRLAHPAHGPALGAVDGVSPVRLHCADFDAAPAARSVRFDTVLLRPGDVLVLPPCWWHEVEVLPEEDGFAAACNFLWLAAG